MKLVNLLDVIPGFAEDADANTPQAYLFGDVTAVFAEYYKSYDRAGISIIVRPYKAG